MIHLKSFGRDINGNSIIKFSISNSYQNKDVWANGRYINTDKPCYGYSLQTNGNLPITHDLKIGGKKVGDLNPVESDTIKTEISTYLIKYGSDKQRVLLNS